METKIKKAKKELIFKNYIVRKDGYSKNYFDNKERAIEELKRIHEEHPMSCSYIRVEYTYWEELSIEEEPF